MTMTRNEFLRSVIGVGVGATAAAVLVGCGGDDGGSTAADDQPAMCTTPTASISANHGHSMTVSLADVEAGVEKTYAITGSSSHTHNVTISGAQMGQLMNGQTLNLTSTSSGHTHTVTVQCVS